jgi:putative transposase
MLLLAHKIALNPNNKQATYLAKASGVSRFAYNWALAEWKQEYEAGGKPTETALRLRFTLTNDQFAIHGSSIRIPHLGWVRMRESLRFAGKILSATISRIANRWFVSIAVETPQKLSLTVNKSQVTVGVDLGVSCFATLSTGEKIAGPKPYQALFSRLRRFSKSLSRKKKGSSNRNKAKIKLSRLHYRITNIRKDALHQLTTKLVKEYAIIGIEDLHVKGMLRNRCLSRSIADMAFHEFRRQLEYKAIMHGKKIIKVNRWFPSSKTCSHCQHRVEKMDLSMRDWICPQCERHHDRDINAAVNLAKWAVSSTVTACGVSSVGTVAQSHC